MKRTVPALSLLLLLLVIGSAALANIRLRIPEDLEPPVYTGSVTPFIGADGTLFAVHDGERAAISFIRPTGLIPVGSNLLDADFSALGKPMLVTGFALFRSAEDRVPIATEARGLGAVPVWFMRWEELRAAMLDGVLTIGELESLPSLLKGTARFYHEQNHFHGVHRVSHLAAVARGTLEDGRSFELQATEVRLGLPHVRIVFR